MTMKLQTLLDKCKAGIEQAARDSYNNGDNINMFDGCYCTIDLDNNSQIEISADRHCELEVIIYHDDCNELPNFESYIKSWLDANADPQAEWQDEYDHDDWRDVDPGCDPAFPHYGDFERWAYGR